SLTVCLLLVAAGVGAACVALVLHREPVSPDAQIELDPLQLEEDSFGHSMRLRLDDSGYLAAQQFVLPVRDPASLEQVRDCYLHPGRRGIQLTETELAQGDLSLQDEANKLMLLAQLYLYEGEFARASATLEGLRRQALANPERLQSGLPTVVSLQGIA